MNLLSYLRRHRISGTPIVSGFVLFLTAFVVYWWGNTSLFFSHGDARWKQDMLNEGFSSGQIYGTLARDFRSGLGLWSAPSLLATDFASVLAMVPTGRTNESIYGAVSVVSLFIAGYVLARALALSESVSSFAGVFLAFVVFMPTPFMWTRVPLQGNFVLIISGLAIAEAYVIRRVTMPTAISAAWTNAGTSGALFIALGSWGLWNLAVLPAWSIFGVALVIGVGGFKGLPRGVLANWMIGLLQILLFVAVMLDFVANTAAVSARDVATGVTLDSSLHRPWIFDDVYPLYLPTTAVPLYSVVIVFGIVWSAVSLCRSRGFANRLLGRLTLSSSLLVTVYSVSHYLFANKDFEIGPAPGYIAMLCFPLWVVSLVAGVSAALGSLPRKDFQLSTKVQKWTARLGPRSLSNLPATSIAVALICWLGAWTLNNQHLREGPLYYPPTISETVERIRDELGSSDDHTFRGRVFLVQDEASLRDGVENQIIYPSPFTKLQRAELVEARVPVLNAYSHTSSTRYMRAMNRWFTDGRPFVRLWASFNRFDVKLAKMLGIRYVFAESAGEFSKIEGVMVTPFGSTVAEVPNPNVGQYSPIETIPESHLEDALGFMMSSKFDPLEVAITDTQIPNLVRADVVYVMANRGVIKVSVKTAGRSLLVLPFEYSSCMRLDKDSSNAELLRANYLLTGIVVDGSGTYVIRVTKNPYLPNGCF